MLSKRSTVALNYEKKIKPFIDRYNWEGRNYPSENDNRKII